MLKWLHYLLTIEVLLMKWVGPDPAGNSSARDMIAINICGSKPLNEGVYTPTRPRVSGAQARATIRQR